jgi:dTDP-4-amino-4,6-dideoxygalactose transaminase
MIVAKGASDSRSDYRPALFYASAREAFRDFLANPAGPKDGGVLLPSFIGWSPREGSGVFDPVRELNLTADFYQLNRDLTVDLVDLAQRLQRGHYRALVLIHYYGRTDPGADQVRDLARTHGVLLVEDLAHGFFSAAVGGLAGSFGHVALYSLHKMFPIPSGGVAVYADSSLIAGQKSTAHGLAEIVLSYDWRHIAATRRDNFLHATARLRELQRRGSQLELIWPRLSEGDVPQTLPIYVMGEGRDAVYERMNAAGFGVVSLYHTLIPQVGPEFVVSHWAASHVLNLPVHQEVSRDALDQLVSALEVCLADVGTAKR